MLARCTSSLDLHMLIVPFWYLFGTLLVPKVATGDSSKFVTNNSDFIRRLFYVAMLLTPAQIKPKSFARIDTRLLLFFSFLPGPGWMRLMFTCVLGR